ncbi:DUF4127 family protein [Paenibacillus sp. JTLBN-2024]
MKKVLYVPLDDRPCNLDDVVVQARAAGIQVITPDAEDVKNRLDTEADAEGNTLLDTHSPVFGDTDRIRRFIQKHILAVDGFIISSDMLAYGGLIGSRRFRTSGGGTYPDYDPETTGLLDVIREIKQTCPHKPVYVLDTIMRLATTVFVEGLTQSAYDEARAFAQQPARPLRNSKRFWTATTSSRTARISGRRYTSTRSSITMRGAISSNRIITFWTSSSARERSIFLPSASTIRIRRACSRMKSTFLRLM